MAALVATLRPAYYTDPGVRAVIEKAKDMVASDDVVMRFPGLR